MVVNGYDISGNLAEVGRRYEVSDGTGVAHIAKSKVSAIAWAESANAGAVTESEPESEQTVEPEDTVQPESWEWSGIKTTGESDG